MTSKQFLIRVFAIVAVAGVALVSLNATVDVYGLFRPVEGRQLGFFGEERLVKYLHSIRYVPENFDGVLLGSSVSDGLDTSAISGYKIYNASINGGNAADALPIAQHLFAAKHYRVAIVSVHRYLTLDHEAKTELMKPRQYWGALGSPQLLAAYISKAAVDAGVRSPAFLNSGALRHDAPAAGTSGDAIRKTVEQIRQGKASIANFDIDEKALQDVNQVLSLARTHSDRLLIYFPPSPSAILDLTKGPYTAYTGRIRTLLTPADTVLDFNGLGYEGLRSDEANFDDGVHPSPAGERLLVQELDRVLNGKTALRSSAQ